MKKNTFREILALLQRLQTAKIAYRLRHSRPDALMVEVLVPGERWEIEFVDYGDEVQTEVERFSSSGEIKDESLLTELFARFSDAADEEVHKEQPARISDKVGRVMPK